MSNWKQKLKLSDSRKTRKNYHRKKPLDKEERPEKIVFFRNSILHPAYYNLDIPVSVQNFDRFPERRHIDIVRYLTVSLKILGAAAAAAAFSLLFVFVFDFLIQSEYFRAEQITVKGNNRLSESEVLEQAQINMGMNILSINLAKAGKLLMSHPWIADAEVRRELPSGIHIRITEHKPAAVLNISYPCSAILVPKPRLGNEKLGNGKECVRRFIVNIHGEIFKEWEESDPDDLPAVYGLGIADINVSGRPRSLPFDAVMEVLNIGRQAGSIIPTGAINRIQVDREMGCTIYTAEGWLNSDTPGQINSVRLGYKDYAAKYRKLEILLSYLKEKQNIINIDSIDLNNLNRVVVNEARGQG
jgi:cell division protein FtsQ